MKIVNIRLVVETDDGGIRQSERQYIPELKRRGVHVIGVILGKSYGSYLDQKVDFKYQIDKETSDYKGRVVERLKKLFVDCIFANTLSNSVYEDIEEELYDLKPCILIINVRRVNLIPVALKLARTVGGKVVYHSGSSFTNGPMGVNHVAYWLLNHIPILKILANSKYSAKSYKLGVDDYVYPGVLTSRVLNDTAPRCIRSELGIAAELPVFLYMARVNWDKAPDLLLEGFLNSSLAQEINAHLIIAGPVQDPALELKLNGLVNKSDAKNRVHIVGKQFDVANWYAAANVFVNSRRGVEPFGISIVEAMAASLPVLSSALGGPSETIRDNLNGWLVYDLTASGYKEAIDRALYCKNSWEEYGRLSQEFSQAFTVENQVGRYLNHCKQWY